MRDRTKNKQINLGSIELTIKRKRPTEEECVCGSEGGRGGLGEGRHIVVAVLAVSLAQGHSSLSAAGS